MAEIPLVSIIIPHLAGKEILRNCLSSLKKTHYPNTEVIVVDNGSTDNSVEDVQEIFPGIHVVKNEKNRGFAGGCNAGLHVSHGEYVLFLNDDTEIVDPEWLSFLVESCEADRKIAACQPKLLSLKNPESFDYAGAAGGLLDIFGFPFACGRIFFTIEQDNQQYDNKSEIFWASGTAMFARKSALAKVGDFDEDFFAHMEEIDLSWRLHLAGYKVIAVPQAVVYHNAGSTLTTDSYLKVLLNHRNSLAMLLKNYAWKNLVWIFPARILLEFIAAIYSLVKRDFVRLRAVFHALGYLIFHAKEIIVKRKQVQRIRKKDDFQIFHKMHRGSIVFAYFVKGVRSVEEL